MPELNELAAALAKAQGELKNATLNKINPHFKSRYADLSAIIDATRATLAKHGLSVVQTTKVSEAGLSLETRLLHSSGQFIVGEYPLPMVTDKPQQMGSALTYARRYSLAAICGISADEDDDANAAQTNGKGGSASYITTAQAKELTALAADVQADKKKFLAYMRAESFEEIPAGRFAQAKAALEAKRPQHMEAAE